MTLAAEQAKAVKNLVYLFEVEVGHRIDADSWTQCAGPNTAVWWISHLAEGEPSRVRECVRATHVISTYAEVASIVACQATAKTWFYDSADGKLYIHTTGGDAPNGSGVYYIAAHFWERFCDRQPDSPNTIVYNGAWYLPYLAADSLGDITLEAAPFSAGGIAQSFGSVKLINADGYFDQRLADYIYSAAQATLKVGAPGDTYAQFVTLWKGWTGNVGWDDERVELGIEDERRIAE